MNNNNRMTIPPPTFQRDGQGHNAHHDAVLMCSVCHEIPHQDPVITTTCQHVFCRSCIIQSMLHRSECPNDRQPLTDSDIQPLNGFSQRIWDVVGVSCPLDDCVWTGNLGNYVTHYETQHITPAEYRGRIQELENQVSELQQRLRRAEASLRRERELSVSRGGSPSRRRIISGWTGFQRNDSPPSPGSPPPRPRSRIAVRLRRQVPVENGPQPLRDQVAVPVPPPPVNQQIATSDSDMGSISEDDDEEIEILSGQISVEGAGTPNVNGVYLLEDDRHEGAPSYVKNGYWKDNPCKFYIFLCTVSNTTKHWYISIVPSGGTRGLSTDIDFYTAPQMGVTVPPKEGWGRSNEGSHPPPKLDF